jgi:hypothetical protein
MLMSPVDRFQCATLCYCLVLHKLAFHIQLRRNGHLGSIAGHAKSAAKEHAKNPEGWADGFARG